MELVVAGGLDPGGEDVARPLLGPLELGLNHGSGVEGDDHGPSF
jgi:hypothetical protein